MLRFSDKINNMRISSKLTLVKLGISPKLQDIRNRLVQYQIYFDQFLALSTKAGFKDWGLEGQLRDAIHLLENTPIHYNKADMLLLRRNEKDYFLRKDLQY